MVMTSLSSFAGDKYFVCSKIDDTQMNEDFIFDQVLDSKESVIKTVIPSDENFKILFFVDYSHKEQQLSIKVKRVGQSKPIDELNITLEYNRAVHLTKNIYCSLKD